MVVFEAHQKAATKAIYETPTTEYDKIASAPSNPFPLNSVYSPNC